MLPKHRDFPSLAPDTSSQQVVAVLYRDFKVVPPCSLFRLLVTGFYHQKQHGIKFRPESLQTFTIWNETRYELNLPLACKCAAPKQVCSPLS